METVRQVIDDDPVPPSRLVPRLPRDLETICLKCLHKEPHKRYESAQALADDLERYLRGEPIKARRTPLWERGGKWVRRHQVATMLLGLGTVGILGSCAGILEYQRTRASGLQHESDRTLALLTEGTNAILAARNAMEQHELTEAMATLTRLQGKLAGESASNLQQLNSMAGSLLKEIDKRLAEERSRDRDVYHRGIMAFLHLKQYDEVIRACDTLLARDKRSAARTNGALARAGLTDFPAQIQDYSQAIALEPGRASVLVRRGWLYLASDAPRRLWATSRRPSGSTPGTAIL